LCGVAISTWYDFSTLKLTTNVLVDKITIALFKLYYIWSNKKVLKKRRKSYDLCMKARNRHEMLEAAAFASGF